MLETIFPTGMGLAGTTGTMSERNSPERRRKLIRAAAALHDLADIVSDVAEILNEKAEEDGETEDSLDLPSRLPPIREDRPI